VLVPNVLQHPKFEVCGSISTPLQHGWQLAEPGSQPPHDALGVDDPPTVVVQEAVLQQPGPQFAAPGVQLAAQPAGRLAPFDPQVFPFVENAHPQPELPAGPPAATSQQVPPTVVAHWGFPLGLQDEEQLPVPPPNGQFTEVQPLVVLVDPPTLQSPPA
jgi:hypothetical protein